MLPIDVEEMRESLGRLRITGAPSAERTIRRHQLLTWMVDAAEQAGVDTNNAKAVLRHAKKRWPGLERLVNEYRRDPGIEGGVA